MLFKPVKAANLGKCFKNQPTCQVRKNMISLPLYIKNYIKGLVCVFENANCVSLSKITNCSHDSLARILNQPKLNWQTLLLSFRLRTFGKLRGGWLIIDDTVIDKKFAKVIENLSWVFDSKTNKSILGLNIVLLTWSDGKRTIPLAIKVYQKSNGKTKIDLALELLNYAHFIGISPEYVVFDAWYAADKVLKKIESFRWFFVTRLRKNRKLDGKKMTKVKPNPYWMVSGRLSGGILVSVVRHGSKYFATDNLSLTKSEVLEFYRNRWSIETVFRVLHSRLGIDQCQSFSLRAQTSHFYLCLLAFMILEKERFDRQTTIYKIKQECSFDFKEADLMVNRFI